MPIFAMPIGRPWGDRALWTCERGCGLLSFLIGPIQRDRGRILMEPGGRDGIDLQGVQCDRPKHAIEIRGKQGIEDLAQPVIVQRRWRSGRAEAGATSRAPPGAPPPYRGHDGHPESPGATPPPHGHTRGYGGVRRAEGIDERSHVELAYYPQHQRQVGHGTDLMNRDRHEAPLLQVLLRGVHHSGYPCQDIGLNPA